MVLLQQTQQDTKILEKVLELDIPAYRDAYSDRTAWLMVCFSDIAYIKFDKIDLDDKKIKAAFTKAVNGIIDDQNRLDTLNRVVDKFIRNHEQEEASLRDNLGLLQYELVEVFDKKGSQALLAKNVKMGRLILAFRGTEPTSVEDIKVDIKARLSSQSGGKAHLGFTEAYMAIDGDIQKALKHPEFSNYRLYITGHSLGGALASIATKRIEHTGGISACYTFGSPRVGNKDWVEGIKPPMYRVVNASDIVPMLPPTGNVFNVLGYIAMHVIPVIGPHLANWLKRYTGYFHSGDMRFLKKSKQENYVDTGLLPHTSFVHRIKLWVNSKRAKKGVEDHSVRVYRKKLAAIAIDRNSVKHGV